MININLNANDVFEDDNIQLGAKIKLTDLFYKNESDVDAEVSINQSSLVIDDFPFVFGYTTKLNDKRWGVNVTITQGHLEVESDTGSPIQFVSLLLDKQSNI